MPQEKSFAADNCVASFYFVGLQTRQQKANTRVQQIQKVRAAAAEAEIETTASSVGDDDLVSVEDLKTGVAHVYGVRGSPEKVCGVIKLCIKSAT